MSGLTSAGGVETATIQGFGETLGGWLGLGWAVARGSVGRAVIAGVFTGAVGVASGGVVGDAPSVPVA